MPRGLKSYIAYDKIAGSQEGAVLVFASTVREARKVAWAEIRDWVGDSWIQMAVKRFKLPPHLEKFDVGLTCVIESPPGCPRCELWGGEILSNDNGEDRCEYCIDDDDEY